MSLTTASVVWCDQNCTSNIVIATDLEHARMTAARAGWVFREGVDCCPIHKPQTGDWEYDNSIRTPTGQP